MAVCELGEVAGVGPDDRDIADRKRGGSFARNGDGVRGRVAADLGTVEIQAARAQDCGRAPPLELHWLVGKVADTLGRRSADGPPGDPLRRRDSLQPRL